MDLERYLSKQAILFEYQADVLNQYKDIKIIYNKKDLRHQFVIAKDNSVYEKHYREVFEKRYGSLTEALNMYKYVSQYAHVIFILRRVILLYAMLQLFERPWL
jgi:hypothetical protein